VTEPPYDQGDEPTRELPVPPPVKRTTVIEDEDHWWEEIDWPGACAFVLALGLSIGLVLGFARWLVQHDPLSQHGATLLSTLGGAIVGTLATYLGRGTKERARRKVTTTTEHDEEAE
jgi:hypothetical protein